jgi:exodeoxyribonuclease V alpha subunit
VTKPPDASSARREITGVIKTVTFRNPETGYMILKTENGVTLCGTFIDPSVDLKGVFVKAGGSWQKHKSYGVQFVFDSLIILENELFYFLTKVVKGLGRRLAAELIRSLGEEKLESILDQSPDHLLAVKGIKEKKLGKIVANWQRYRQLKALSKFLLPLGATHNFVQKVHREFEDETDLVERIRENPYILTRIRGVGFKSADQIGRAMGVEPINAHRIESCLEYVLFDHTDSHGNSCIDRAGLLELAEAELLSGVDDFHIEAPLFDEILARMVEKGSITFLGEDKLTSTYLYKAEVFIRDEMARRSQPGTRPLVPDIEAYARQKEAEMGIRFSDEQTRALGIINGGPRVFALCGYAGTGKSTIARAILDLFAGRVSREAIMCCAVSGIASDRIRKTSGYPAQTIYSLIYKHRDEAAEFPFAVLLVDEASMVNTELLYKLIGKLRPDSTLILVGDPAQLPPIGAGEPFSDIVELGLAPTVSLTRIYRQREDKVIALFANEIRKGQVPEGYQTGRFCDFEYRDLSLPGYYALRAKVLAGEMAESDFKALKDRNTARIYDAVTRLTESYKAGLAAALQRKDFAEFLTAIQIITPMKGGLLGTEHLNMTLQARLNRYVTVAGKCVDLGRVRLALCDKVVHIQNANLDCISPEGYKKARRTFRRERIFNGMIGVIIRIDMDEELLHVLYPADRTIVEYSFEEARMFLRLGYALTIHKVQGSEFRHILLPMSFQHFIMLNSKLLYTAITRAREKVLVVGEDYAFRAACQKKEATVRDTVLKLLGTRLGP